MGPSLLRPPGNRRPPACLYCPDRPRRSLDVFSLSCPCPAKGGQTAYNVALRDAMSPPVIDGVDISGYKGTVGDLISVKARDVITPASVKITILSATGVVLEQGDAVIKTNDRRFWIYTVTAANAALTGTRVVATATDLPGNEAEKTATIS